MKSFRSNHSKIAEPAVDVILLILEKSFHFKPASAFISSLLEQYRERGGLSKKQLEGLHSKASKIEGISPAHLATLQAIINKKQTRYKSDLPATASTEEEKDNDGELIKEILERYPLHKRLLYFKLKNDKGESLISLEKEELKKFHKLLIKT